MLIWELETLALKLGQFLVKSPLAGLVVRSFFFKTKETSVTYRSLLLYYFYNYINEFEVLSYNERIDLQLHSTTVS